MTFAKMALNQTVATDTTEESGAVVFVSPDKFKKSLRAVRRTLFGAASAAKKRGAWDHGLVARIVARRCSGAHIPITLFAKRAHPLVPLAGLTATTRSGGQGWSRDRSPHFAFDGPAPGDRLFEDSAKASS
jgi:hypothetical protein